MMGILMSKTCWAHKKWNKIATSDIKLVFYSSTESKSLLSHFAVILVMTCNNILRVSWCCQFLVGELLLFFFWRAKSAVAIPLIPHHCCPQCTMSHMQCQHCVLAFHLWPLLSPVMDVWEFEWARTDFIIHSFIHSTGMCRVFTVPCCPQQLLPFLSVVYYFLPLFCMNYSSILPHFFLPSIFWSTSQSSCFQIHI